MTQKEFQQRLRQNDDFLSGKINTCYIVYKNKSIAITNTQKTRDDMLNELQKIKP